MHKVCIQKRSLANPFEGVYLGHLGKPIFIHLNRKKHFLFGALRKNRTRTVFFAISAVGGGRLVGCLLAFGLNAVSFFTCDIRRAKDFP